MNLSFDQQERVATIGETEVPAPKTTNMQTKYSRLFIRPMEKCIRQASGRQCPLS